MLKKLLGGLFGEFPPKSLPLCSKCRASYTVAGIIKPPISFDEMVKLLYQYDLLCDEPCGVTTPHLLPQQHSGSSRLPIIFEMFRINCNNCVTSFIALSLFAQNERDVNRAIKELRRKSLICDQCLDAFLDNADAISYQVISALKGSNHA